MKSQVLIVGAGPVGLTMANELARFGIRVRIIEKSPQRTDKSKAIVLWSRTLELFDRSAMSEQFVAAGHRVTGANIIAGTKVIAHINFDSVSSPYPYALMLPQSDTERLLEEQLERQQIQVERQVELISFLATDHDVTALLRHADGRDETVETGWLIGCDGAHSTVRHTLGMSFLGDTLQSNWILADLHLAGFPFPESEIATYWHQDGVLVIFPISPGRFRVIANVSLAEGTHPADPTLEEVQKVIDQRGPGGIVASHPVWLAAFRINERKVANYQTGRVFVAGDAAHVHSPAGGQGMNTGMQDAFNLAWKLALVCQGASSEKLLESYSVERSAVGEQVLKAAGRLTAVATMQNHTAQALRNLLGHALFGFAPVRQSLANQMAEIGIGYKDSPITGPAAHGMPGPVPGERVVPIASQIAVGSGNRPRFTLFADADGKTLPLLLKYEQLLDPVLRPPFHTDGMWLVRPDGYVACVTRVSEIHVIAEYLDHLLP